MSINTVVPEGGVQTLKTYASVALLVVKSTSIVCVFRAQIIIVMVLDRFNF